MKPFNSITKKERKKERKKFKKERKKQRELATLLERVNLFFFERVKIRFFFYHFLVLLVLNVVNLDVKSDHRCATSNRNVFYPENVRFLVNI